MTKPWHRILMQSILLVVSSAQNVVVTNNPYCTQIGEDLIKIGGNVREVFIAVSLCEGLVHPMDSGLGGGFQAVYFNAANHNAVFLDSREQAPTHSQFATMPITEGNSIGIPSVLAGYEALYNIDRHLNRLHWSQIIEPVWRLCRNGYILTSTSKRMIETLIHSYNGTWTNLRHLKILTFCETLAQISKDGPTSSMYKPNGYLNRLLYYDLRSSKSLITQRNIRQYRPKLSAPAAVKFGVFTVYASKSPGSGEALLFALKIIERMRQAMNTNTSYAQKLVWLLKILKYTYALQPHLTEISQATIHKILNESAQSIADGIIQGGMKFRNTIPQKFGNVTLAKLVSPVHYGTTNVVIKVGNSAITASSSINQLYGSGIFSASMGFFYNNHLRDFKSPNWRRKNRPLKNSPGPGRVPSSSISPLIFVEPQTGRPVLQIGSAGGSRILSAITNTFFYYFIMNTSLLDSVNACRITPKFNYAKNHVKFSYECIGDERIAQQLRNLGIDFEMNIDAGFAAVTAFSSLRGRVTEAVFDKRRGGAVFVG